MAKDELVVVVEHRADGTWSAQAIGVRVDAEADSLDGLKDQLLEVVDMFYPDETDRPRTIRLRGAADETFPVS